MYLSLKHTSTPTLISLSDHDIQIREWEVIVDEVQNHHHGIHSIMVYI